MVIGADRRSDCCVIELFWQWRLQMGSDERAIREVHTTWIDAVNAGDLVRLLTLMADDVALASLAAAQADRN
jgi:ketosteroid isomerase-like protein